MENNNWLMALAVIAVVGIVGVFGIVQMTGYAVNVEHSLSNQQTADIFKNFAETARIKAEVDRTMRSMNADARCLWVEYNFGTTQALGVNVYVNGRLDHELTVQADDVLKQQILATGSQVFVVNPSETAQAFNAWQVGGQIFGVGGTDIGAY